MKDDFDYFADRAGEPGRSRTGDSDDAIVPGPTRHRKNKFLVALIVFVVVAVVVVALVVSFGVLTGHNKKSGGTASASSSAPYSSTVQMKKGMEAKAGACSGGWTDADASQFPGVSAASVCVSGRYAFVTFESKTAASVDGPLVRSKAGDLLSRYLGDNSGVTSDYRLLDGGQWMAVGDKSQMASLQDQWGGEIETLGEKQ